jgi:hypothetical protein
VRGANEREKSHKWQKRRRQKEIGARQVQQKKTKEIAYFVN